MPVGDCFIELDIEGYEMQKRPEKPGAMIRFAWHYRGKPPAACRETRLVDIAWKPWPAAERESFTLLRRSRGQGQLDLNY